MFVPVVRASPGNDSRWDMRVLTISHHGYLPFGAAVGEREDEKDWLRVLATKMATERCSIRKRYSAIASGIGRAASISCFATSVPQDGQMPSACRQSTRRQAPQWVMSHRFEPMVVLIRTLHSYRAVPKARYQCCQRAGVTNHTSVTPVSSVSEACPVARFSCCEAQRG